MHRGGDGLTVYLDLVMLLNFGVDFLLLLGTNRLAGFPPGYRRLLPASAMGGIYSGVCLLPGFGFLAAWIWRGISLALMCAIAYGLNRSAIKRGGLFLLLSGALGGFALRFGSLGFGLLLLFALGVWLLCAISSGSGVGEQRFVPVRLSYQGNTVCLTALRDTGNTLIDPITGEKVLVISSAAGASLTGLSPWQIANPLDTVQARPIPGLRLIPYCSVGNDKAMMLAMRMQDVTIGKRKGSAVVAFAPTGLDGKSGYEALTGG